MPWLADSVPKYFHLFDGGILEVNDPGTAVLRENDWMRKHLAFPAR
jgi:hypothetical protein